MKMKTKVIAAALAAAGIVTPLTALAADTITGTVNPPTPQAPVPASGYTATYPVTVQLTGGSPQNLNFVYNGSTGQWTAPAGWAYDASLNPNANTAVFTTTQGGVSYGVALSSTGTTQFVPSAGTPATTTPPSVGLTATTVSSTLTGFGAATASGTITGFGQTTAPLVPAPATAQLIGVGTGGAPVGTICVDNNPASPSSPACSAGPIAVTPTVGTSPPGKAGGAVTVNSNQPSQPGSVGFGQYTATFPTTNTPAGTATINGTIAGATGSFGANGISLNNITGTAVYCTGNPGSSCAPGTITASPVTTATFSVSPNGQTTTTGLTNNGTFTNNGNAAVNGQLSTVGLVNTGAMSTTTLTVVGQTTTNGITNFGTLQNNGNANVTGNATIGGTLGVTGNATIGGTLTVNGATNFSGPTTLGSTASTGGNTVTVNSSGVALSGPGGNSVIVNSAGTAMTGGGATLALANGKATFGGPVVSGTTGAPPITVTGVADGSSQYDAVNFGQLDEVKKQESRGVAALAAITNIPQVEQGKTFNLGVGVGGFNGETGWAIGGSLRVARDGILKASVGSAGSGGSKAVWGVGGGWSWQ